MGFDPTKSKCNLSKGRLTVAQRATFNWGGICVHLLEIITIYLMYTVTSFLCLCRGSDSSACVVQVSTQFLRLPILSLFGLNLRHNTRHFRALYMELYDKTSLIGTTTILCALCRSVCSSQVSMRGIHYTYMHTYNMYSNLF